MRQNCLKNVIKSGGLEKKDKRREDDNIVEGGVCVCVCHFRISKKKSLVPSLHSMKYLKNIFF